MIAHDSLLNFTYPSRKPHSLLYRTFIRLSPVRVFPVGKISDNFLLICLSVFCSFNIDKLHCAGEEK
ncbi:hypothetical protein GCWU000342_01122 [Shuttleworthella satelles DSM 14600]|uniref:Uncharacterized protein n=1 Tax=Shuttleworthella satelles DSM 14600 TaxID=626523 RepID=C4GB22_9FIRM|nr:hypothetical protein GCWU000342_01122 [Shuttleworthia satelles DSM 14600]